MNNDSVPPWRRPWRERPSAPSSGTILCALEDIDTPGAKSFVFDGGSEKFLMFLVRNDQGVFGYVNACPHMFTPLAFLRDGFLNEDKNEIVCATHGATFSIDQGVCLSGPCEGDHLVSVDITVRDRKICIE